MQRFRCVPRFAAARDEAAATSTRHDKASTGVAERRDLRRRAVTTARIAVHSQTSAAASIFVSRELAAERLTPPLRGHESMKPSDHAPIHRSSVNRRSTSCGQTLDGARTLTDSPTHAHATAEATGKRLLRRVDTPESRRYQWPSTLLPYRTQQEIST